MYKYFLYGFIAVILLACNFSNASENGEFDQEIGGNANYKDQALVDVAGELFEVEIAQSVESREIGLSGRPYMPNRGGMLFMFEKPGMHNFWMKDMEFPLDFVWIDSDCLVSDLTENVSHIEDKGTADISTYSPSRPIKYVLEINAGISQTAGIQVGQRVRFMGDIETEFGC